MRAPSRRSSRQWLPLTAAVPDILYRTSPAPDYLAASVETVMAIHEQEPAGDVLVFLPGMEEIEHVVRELRVRVGGHLRVHDGGQSVWH